MGRRGTSRSCSWRRHRGSEPPDGHHQDSTAGAWCAPCTPVAVRSDVARCAVCRREWMAPARPGCQWRAPCCAWVAAELCFAASGRACWSWGQSQVPAQSGMKPSSSTRLARRPARTQGDDGWSFTGVRPPSESGFLLAHGQPWAKRARQHDAPFKLAAHPDRSSACWAPASCDTCWARAAIRDAESTFSPSTFCDAARDAAGPRAHGLFARDPLRRVAPSRRRTARLELLRRLRRRGV